MLEYELLWIAQEIEGLLRGKREEGEKRALLMLDVFLVEVHRPGAVRAGHGCMLEDMTDMTDIDGLLQPVSSCTPASQFGPFAGLHSFVQAARRHCRSASTQPGSLTLHGLSVALVRGTSTVPGRCLSTL